MRNSRTLALPALLFALSLTACAARPPLARTEVVTVRTPAALRECKPAPAAPAVVDGDQEVAMFIQDLSDAGADCREKIARRNALEDAGSR